MKRRKRKGQSGKIPPKPAKFPHLLKQKKKTPARSVVIWLRTKLILASFVSVIGVAGSFVTFYSLSPRLQIYPSGLLEPSSPFSTQFEILNSGYWEAENICIALHINGMNVKDSDGRRIIGSGTIITPGLDIPRLRGGEKSTFPLDKATSFLPKWETMKGVSDINLEASYRIHYLGFLGLFNYAQRFVTKTNFMGNVQWNAVQSN